MDKDKYLIISWELIESYNVKCYKKNDKDKLYSFIFFINDVPIYNDLAVDRFICQKYKFTLKELRRVKHYLRLYAQLCNLEEYVVCKQD